MTLKGKIATIRHHPSIIMDLLSGKNRSEIRTKLRQLDQIAHKKADDAEIRSFIGRLKQASSYSYRTDPNGRIRLNKLMLY